MQRIVDLLLTLDAVALWKISWDKADIIMYKSGSQDIRLYVRPKVTMVIPLQPISGSRTKPLPLSPYYIANVTTFAPCPQSLVTTC